MVIPDVTYFVDAKSASHPLLADFKPGGSWSFWGSKQSLFRRRRFYLDWIKARLVYTSQIDCCRLWIEGVVLSALIPWLFLLDRLLPICYGTRLNRVRTGVVYSFDIFARAGAHGLLISDFPFCSSRFFVTARWFVWIFVFYSRVKTCLRLVSLNASFAVVKILRNV